MHKGDKALLALLGRGFAQISAAEHRQIAEKWRGSTLHSLGESPISAALRIGLWSAAALTMVLLLWNLTLRKRVQQKTQVLTQSLVELSQAKQVSEQSMAQLQTMLENDMVGIAAKCLDQTTGAQGITQQQGGGVVAGLVRVGPGKAGWLNGDKFQLGDQRDVLAEAVVGPEPAGIARHLAQRRAARLRADLADYLARHQVPLEG